MVDVSSQVLSTFSYLLHARSIEFFSSKSAEKLALSWRSAFLTVQPCLWTSLLSNSSSAGHVENSTTIVPLSFLCLRTIVRANSIDRNPLISPQCVHSYLCSTSSCQYECGPSFKSVTTKISHSRIKLKKKHELDRIVELVKQLKTCGSSSGEVDCLVDIGAGIGHLSRIVASETNLRVFAIEGRDEFTITAEEMDRRLSAKEDGQIIQLDNLPTRHTFLVTEALADKIDKFAMEGAILVGLHACGDLSSVIAKLFLKSNKAKHLVLVGCCYHKEFECFHFAGGDALREESSSSEKEELKSSVFPISKKWKDVNLSYLSRELACHNKEKKLLDPMSFEVGAASMIARARLEQAISEATQGNYEANQGMCGVKNVADLTFGEYMEKAMTKRGQHLYETVVKHINSTDPSLMTTPISTMDTRGIIAIESLRSVLAPLVETMIIDDRLSFFREHGVDAKVLPLFDPTISPRSLVIVASKK